MWIDPEGCDYPSIAEWYGTPDDLAWMLEHSSGFPGRVIPQAFQDDPLADYNQNIIFRLGTRYFSYRTDEREFRSLAGTPSGNFDACDGQLEVVARPTAMMEHRLYA
jgi:hypothetical protein